MRGALVVLLLQFVSLYAQRSPIEFIGQPMILSDSSQYYMAPVWSPDIANIATTGSRYHGISILKFPDGRHQQISSARGAGFGMSWSPDGELIAARLSKQENRRTLYAIVTINVIDFSVNNLSGFSGQISGVPRWTRDQSQVYTTGGRRFGRYETVQANRGQLSPAPLSIDFVDNQISFRLEAGSVTPIPVTLVPGRVLTQATSPNGQLQVVEIKGGSIWIVHTDGSAPFDLGPGDDPAWSPNSDMLAFSRSTDDGHRLTSADIIIASAYGNWTVTLVPEIDRLEVHPTWSPDGGWLAYATEAAGYIMIQQIR